MYRINDLLKGLTPLVGWGLDPQVKIQKDLTLSSTGMTFQQRHPIVTLSNLKNCCPDYTDLQIADWSETVQYVEGEVVKFDDVNYEALADSINEEPSSVSEFWKEYDPFSSWLKMKTKASITKLISNLVTLKGINGSAKNLLSNTTYFDGVGSLINQSPRYDKLVGFVIKPKYGKGLSLRINKLGLQFTGPCTFPLYVYHTSNNRPFKVINCEVGANNTFKWLNIDLDLPYISDSTVSNGFWLLAYNPSEVTNDAKAVNRGKNYVLRPCLTCNPYDVIRYNQINTYAEVVPFSTADTRDGVLFDTEEVDYVTDNNFGLNIDMSVLCDITDTLLDNKDAFANAIATQVAVDMLREIAYNPNARLNRNVAVHSRAELLYEVDGDSTSYKKSGLAYELSKTLEALNLDLNGINKVCLPPKRTGVRMRNI
jgi:hypothetical protein